MYQGASPIWRRIILESLSGMDPVNFEVPEGIVTAEVDKMSGKLAHDNFPSRSEFLQKDQNQQEMMFM